MTLNDIISSCQPPIAEAASTRLLRGLQRCRNDPPPDPQHERTYGQIFTFKSEIARRNQQHAMRVCSPNRDNGTGDL
jgi:hypothetical protein